LRDRRSVDRRDRRDSGRAGRPCRAPRTLRPGSASRTAKASWATRAWGCFRRVREHALDCGPRLR